MLGRGVREAVVELGLVAAEAATVLQDRNALLPVQVVVPDVVVLAQKLVDAAADVLTPLRPFIARDTLAIESPASLAIRVMLTPWLLRIG